MEYIFIDLDGTIINSKIGITKAIEYTLGQWNIIVEDLESLTKFIGPPIQDTFIEDYNFSKEEASLATELYRKYFEENGFYEDEVYKGIEELLIRLKQANKKMIVATSKRETTARRIIEYFKLSKYFDDICGADHEGRSKKEEVIRYAIEKNGIMDYSQVVMVGDRKYDIEGAKAVGIPSIGVLYGFGSREELIEAGANQIAVTVKDLYEVIINFKL